MMTTGMAHLLLSLDFLSLSFSFSVLYNTHVTSRLMYNIELREDVVHRLAAHFSTHHPRWVASIQPSLFISIRPGCFCCLKIFISTTLLLLLHLRVIDAFHETKQHKISFLIYFFFFFHLFFLWICLVSLAGKRDGRHGQFDWNGCVMTLLESKRGRIIERTKNKIRSEGRIYNHVQPKIVVLSFKE
jgi:hypothetical protein